MIPIKAKPLFEPRSVGPKLVISFAVAVIAAALFVPALPAGAAAKTYPIVVGSHGLRVREGPGTNSRVVGSLFNGDRVRVLCTVTPVRGESIRGPLGTSKIWNKIGTNRYVPDSFVRTGSDKAIAPPCSLVFDNPNVDTRNVDDLRCTFGAPSASSFSVGCPGGTYRFRAIARCDRKHWADYWTYGPIKREGVSIAYCSDGQRAFNHRYEIIY